MTEHSQKSSIKGLFQEIVPTAAELLQGIVISAEPVKIQIVNDSKLIIGPAITVVPKHLTNYETAADITWGENTALSNDTRTQSGDKLTKFQISGAKMTVHNALRAGDAVHVLALQSGKKYFVLGRV